MKIDSRQESEKMEVENSVCDEYDEFVFIDLQGFRDHHRFICKEFSLCGGDYKYHAIIKSPYSFKKLNDFFQRQAIWAMNHCHGKHYDSSDVNIVEVISKVYPKIMKKKIVVKHPWKIAWLQYIFRNCDALNYVCIDDLGLDMTARNELEYGICGYHNENYGWNKCRCALATVLEMEDIIYHNIKKRKVYEHMNELMSIDLE